MENSSHTRLSRRGFLTGSAAALGGLSVAGEGVTLPLPPLPGDSVIDQIVEMFGGWDFDQDAAQRAVAEAKTSEARRALPAQFRALGSRSHGMQAAMQAEKDGAEAPMIIAGLLHDIGHLFSPPAPQGVKDYDDMHEVYAALWLRNVFVPEVSEPVYNHVPGKRYLVTTRKEYWDKLSSGSQRSLENQGGKMSKAELEAFELRAFFKEGVQVRLWDDRAKVKGLKLPKIDRYARMMEQVLKSAR